MCVFSNLLQDMQTISLIAFELQIAIYPIGNFLYSCILSLSLKL